MTPELFIQFNSWVDRIVSEVGITPVVAYNFNLYEHEDEFVVQLVGTGSFDIREEDWACNETFSSGEDLFYLPHAVFGNDWRKGLEMTIVLVKNYLQQGHHAAFLKVTRGVGVGFVDGNIDIVYLREDA